MVIHMMIDQVILYSSYYVEYNLEMVLFLDRRYFHLNEIKLYKYKITRKQRQKIFLLESVPFNVVGHVEIISFVLFLVGNEKSLRGQQLISI